MLPARKHRPMIGSGPNNGLGTSLKIGEVEKLQSLIIMVGDKPVQAVAMIHDVADVIVRDYETHVQTILKTFTGCATELSHKPHAYASLLSTIASLSAEIGQSILDAVQAQCALALAEDRTSYVRTLFRFFACCASLGVVAPESLMTNLLLFVDSLANGQLDHRNDFYAGLVLNTLLFAPRTCAPEEVVERVAAYVAKRSADPARVALRGALLPLDPAHAPVPQEDYLAVLLAQTQHALALPAMPVTTWPQALPTPTVPMVLGPMQLPPHLTLSHFLAPPYVYVRIFEDTVMVLPGGTAQFKAHVPATLSAERLLTVEILYDLLNNIQYNHKEGSKFLMDVKLLFLAKTYAATTDVYGPQHGEHAESPEFQFEQVLVEVLMSCLFRLPLSQVRPIFYTDVIMGLCKLAPKTMAPALGKAIQLCFARLEYMDIDCLIRFVDFFSHHLSLFSFAWNWKDWSFCLAQPGNQRLFVLAILEKITRLAYFDRIQQSLPDAFRATYAALEPRPHLHFTAPTFEAFSEQLVAMVRVKTPWEELHQYLLQFQKNTQCARGELQQCAMTSLLVHGQKTFSHAMTVLERYLPLLHALVLLDNEEDDDNMEPDAEAADAPTGASRGGRGAKWEYLDAVYTFWQFHHQFFLIILDKLMQYRLVLGQDVLLWAFQSPRLNEPVAVPPVAPAEGEEAAADTPATEATGCSPLFFLEILCLTIKKALHRIDYLEDKLKTAIESCESDDVIEKLEQNLKKANSEKHSLFLLVVQKLIEKFTSDPHANTVPADQHTHWQNWVLGSLVTLVRMYVADFDTHLKNDIMKLLQEEQTAMLPKVSEVLVSILFME